MESPYPFRIGKLAKMSGLSIPALRYYERRGLLKPLRRSQGGYRVYDIAAFLKVESLKQLQRSGFTLAEIRELFKDGPALWNSPRMRQAMQRKLAEVQARIAELKVLEAGLRAWDGEGPVKIPRSKVKPWRKR